MAERTVTARWTRWDEEDRKFDIEYWQAQGDAAIFDAAWQLVEFYWEQCGRDLRELRLQRSVGGFQPAPH